MARSLVRADDGTRYLVRPLDELMPAVGADVLPSTVGRPVSLAVNTDMRTYYHPTLTSPVSPMQQVGFAPPKRQPSPKQQFSGATLYKQPIVVRGANRLSVPVLSSAVSPRRNEFCMECTMRDRDMADIDVMTPSLWATPNDEVFTMLDPVAVDPLTKENLAIWTEFNHTTSSDRYLRVSNYVDEQRGWLEAARKDGSHIYIPIVDITGSDESSVKTNGLVNQTTVSSDQDDTTKLHPTLPWLNVDPSRRFSSPALAEANRTKSRTGRESSSMMSFAPSNASLIEMHAALADDRRLGKGLSFRSASNFNISSMPYSNSQPVLFEPERIDSPPKKRISKGLRKIFKSILNFTSHTKSQHNGQEDSTPLQPPPPLSALAREPAGSVESLGSTYRRSFGYNEPRKSSSSAVGLSPDYQRGGRGSYFHPNQFYSNDSLLLPTASIAVESKADEHRSVKRPWPSITPWRRQSSKHPPILV